MVKGELWSSPRAKRRKSDVGHADICELLITGCRDTQTSAHAFINGTYNGALTYYLVQSIREANGKLSYRELHKQTLAKLKGEYDQVPQLEERKNHLIVRSWASPSGGVRWSRRLPVCE